MAKHGAGIVFFLLIQTLSTFLATWILILRISMLDIVLDSKFLDFQVPRFPQSGLGRAWADRRLRWPGPAQAPKYSQNISLSIPHSILWTIVRTIPLVLPEVIDQAFIRIFQDFLNNS